MEYVNGIRKAVLAMAALSAVLTATACQPSASTGADSPSEASSGSSSAVPPSSSSAASGSASTAPASGSPAGAEKTCAADAVEAAVYQAADRPEGTGTGAVVVGFTNVSAQPCVLRGHPSVAGAGNGSPEHNAPLKVTPSGSPSPVRVAPGGSAWLKLTFVQVQGEADGYCESGAQPVAYPTLVVGLPGSGAHQVALEDGLFAECDNTVTATAVSATKPS